MIREVDLRENPILAVVISEPPLHLSKTIFLNLKCMNLQISSMFVLILFCSLSFHSLFLYFNADGLFVNQCYKLGK